MIDMSCQCEIRLPKGKVIVRGILILLAGLVLAGCDHVPVRISGSGVEAPPPVGYIVWCAENPADPMCGAKQ